MLSTCETFSRKARRPLRTSREKPSTKVLVGPRQWRHRRTKTQKTFLRKRTRSTYDRCGLNIQVRANTLPVAVAIPLRTISSQVSDKRRADPNESSWMIRCEENPGEWRLAADAAVRNRSRTISNLCDQCGESESILWFNADGPEDARVDLFLAHVCPTGWTAEQCDQS